MDALIVLENEEKESSFWVEMEERLNPHLVQLEKHMVRNKQERHNW